MAAHYNPNFIQAFMDRRFVPIGNSFEYYPDDSTRLRRCLSVAACPITEEGYEFRVAQGSPLRDLGRAGILKSAENEQCQVKQTLSTKTTPTSAQDADYEETARSSEGSDGEMSRLSEDGSTISSAAPKAAGSSLPTAPPPSLPTLLGFKSRIPPPSLEEQNLLKKNVYLPLPNRQATPSAAALPPSLPAPPPYPPQHYAQAYHCVQGADQYKAVVSPSLSGVTPTTAPGTPAMSTFSTPMAYRTFSPMSDDMMNTPQFQGHQQQKLENDHNRFMMTPACRYSEQDSSRTTMMKQDHPEQKNAEEEEPVTTLMIRNLPLDVSQSRFMEELDGCGFAGLYDFCYLPRSFQTGENHGYAFVNFASPAAAGLLVGAWQRQIRFQPSRPLSPTSPSACPTSPSTVNRQPRPLNISPAALQGKDANEKKWCNTRLNRIRNKDFRPFTANLTQWGSGQ